MDEKLDQKSPPPFHGEDDENFSVRGNGQLVNASGHVQELDRSFGFFSICSIGIISDNAWGAGGGALVVA
jgi:choline transport protein